MWGADQKFRHEGNCSASGGLPNSYPSDGIFNSHRRTIMDSFPWIHFLRKLYLKFHMRCYINTTMNYLLFRSRHDQFGFCLKRWRRNVWRKMTANWTWWRQKWRVTSKSHPDVMLESCLTPLLTCKTTFPSSGRVYGNSCRVCKKNDVLNTVRGPKLPSEHLC